MSATWPRVGRLVYGGASIALGLIGLRWGDFAAVWQPVPPTMPHRAALAYVAAVALVLGGAATLHRRTARIGAVALGVVYLGVALPWLRRVIHYPQLSGTWLGFLEQFALVAAAMVPTWLPPDQRFWIAATGAFQLLAAGALLSGIRAQLAARLLAVMLLGFGALVWASMLAADPGAHMRWAGNAVNLAIAGAAWVVADALDSGPLNPARPWART
ncbi:MAG TPA: hypothetical protein VKA54_12360 [Gemmatimonadaceae bacterium]|nr:hypothetical protein [Gemmatimonadaceae bacterium]